MTYICIYEHTKKKIPLAIHFIYLANKQIYCIFKDTLHNLRFIFHQMMFISGHIAQSV